MKTSTKIILGVLGGVAVIVLLAISIVVGGYFYFDRATHSAIDAQERVQAAGKAFGETTDNAGCMEKTFVLEAPFTSFDHSRMFARECLRASRLTPNFCDAVPPPLSNLDWADTQCKRLGRDTALCRAAFDSKMFFCEKRVNK